MTKQRLDKRAPLRRLKKNETPSEDWLEQKYPDHQWRAPQPERIRGETVLLCQFCTAMHGILPRPELGEKGTKFEECRRAGPNSSATW